MFIYFLLYLTPSVCVSVVASKPNIKVWHFSFSCRDNKVKCKRRVCVCFVTRWQFGGSAGFSAALAAMSSCSSEPEKPKEEISVNEVQKTHLTKQTLLQHMQVLMCVCCACCVCV